MARREETEPPVATAACQKCGETVPAIQLLKCPWCFKDFCATCRFPRGVSEFCSRACAEAMFHGGDEEDGAEDD